LLASCTLSCLHTLFPRKFLISAAIRYNRSGGELCACLFMVELSNPFMHARYIFLNLAVDTRRPSLYV
jgi:hypothetical protein